MAINNQPTIKPQTVTGIFTKYIAKTLPLAFDESMSYYECLCALLEYINTKVVPALDNNAAGLAELQEFYLELQNYVNNYFDNLDVQEEINNKLDDMVKSGVLDKIIEQYLNSSAIWGFDTVQDMKEATNLIDGSFAKTLGYYTKNDGGSALYKIREKTISDNIDEAFIIKITEELVAELIFENNTINALQLGIKRNDNTYNAHDLILYTAQNYDVELYFPTGSYYTSQLFFDKHCHVNLKGDSTCYVNKTWFIPYGTNNGYIIKCGGKENYSVDDLSDYTINLLSGIKINGITFSDWSNKINKSKYNYNCCLAIDNCSSIELNVKFYYCSCNGLLIRESWELQSNYISCRAMYGTFETCGILFANKAITNSGSNISALMFDLLDFEQINGKCIVTESNANCGNIAINKISIENGRGNIPDLLSVKVANITTDEINTYRETYHFNPLLSFTGFAITIGTINTDYVGTCYYYRDGVSADGKWTDALLSVKGDIAISTIGMPSLMIAILTKYYSNIFENVTISSFTSNPGESFSANGRKVAQFVYIIPEELSQRDSCTFVDIQDNKIIKNPDYIKNFGNGFWQELDLFEWFIPHKGWQNYAIVNDKICYVVFNTANVGGFLNKIYIPNGKKLRIYMKTTERILADAAPLQLLNNTDNVVETIASGIDDWEIDEWHIVEYTITATSYSRLKLALARPCVIEWIEIGD